jgi:hypothetical protein
MDTDSNKDTARRIATEIFTNPDGIRELCTQDLVAHHSWGADFRGVEEVISLLKRHTTRARVVIEDCLAESERVAVRFRVTFTAEGAREIVRNEIAILRFEGGRMAEWWGAYDRQSEREQRGEP